MTNARKDGQILLLLGGLLFLFFGLSVLSLLPLRLADFKHYYYGAYSLRHHIDPYQGANLWSVYQSQGGAIPAYSGSAAELHRNLSRSPNLPNTFFFFSPLSCLPFSVAAAVWIFLIITAFLAACRLAWEAGAEWDPLLAGGLVFLVLINSNLLLTTGNSAGFVVSLAVIAVWCFHRNRFAAAGVLCLFLSLALKPQDGWLVWLFLFLAGGVMRKRAMQTAVLAAILVLVALVWVTHAAPLWRPEIAANLHLISAPGGLNDPGPTSLGGRGIGMVLCLQTVTSLIRNDPGFYNPPVYLFCAFFLVLWAYRVWRTKGVQIWFALAAIAPLTMLPVYHRTYDAKLLLLTIPACAMLWNRGGGVARCALALNLCALLFTGDSFWVVIFLATHNSRLWMTIAAVLAPLALAAAACFYLWIFWRSPEPAAGA